MENETKLTPEEMQNWLGTYVNGIVIKVMAKFDEIQNNEFAVKMIKELYVRTLKEKEDEVRSFEGLMRDFNGYKDFNIYSHSLEHASSYRDILYDMFIKVI